MRGKPSRQGRQTGISGSIPACAGETSCISISTKRPTVYPRVCGGNAVAAAPVLQPNGLSPRVRGKLPLRLAARRPARSIPACAGETCRWRPAAAGNRVYPRVCGGNTDVAGAMAQTDGLSPRVRGKLPAASNLVSPFTVYPRVCGGNNYTWLDGGDSRGLSPRVRGKLSPADPAVAAQGSIPACAGETYSIYRYPQIWEVYPRVCGGNREKRLKPAPKDGLSPRVRGKPSPSTGYTNWRRSIPACAGETNEARRFA